MSQNGTEHFAGNQPNRPHPDIDPDRSKPADGSTAAGFAADLTGQAQ